MLRRGASRCQSSYVENGSRKNATRFGESSSFSYRYAEIRKNVFFFLQFRQFPAPPQRKNSFFTFQDPDAYLAGLRSPVAGFIDEITGAISMAKEKVRHRAVRAISENKKNVG